MLVAFATAVQIATATPRFALGLGIVEEIHARMSWNIEKAPIAWRNIAFDTRWSVLHSISCLETNLRGIVRLNYVWLSTELGQLQRWQRQHRYGSIAPVSCHCAMS